MNSHSYQHKSNPPDCSSAGEDATSMNPRTTSTSSAAAATAATKTIYLIRHAESNENLFYNAARRTWGKLSQFSPPAASDLGTTLMLPFVMFNKNTTDAEVSEHGQKQIRQLRRTVTDDEFMFVVKGDKDGGGAEEAVGGESIKDLKNDLVVVHSPLKRARQTAYGIIKGMDVREISDDAPANSEFEELGCLREINPKEIMRHGNRALDKRIAVFEDWIMSRQEKHIAVIGHSVYFQRMLLLPRPFANCDVWEVKFTPGISEDKKIAAAPVAAGGGAASASASVHDGRNVEDDMETHVPPRSWHNMKLLYRYTPDSIFEGLLS